MIVAIAVGGMPAWEDDIEIPGRHGVFMHIADSIGPGGMLRAFRNLPVIESICTDLAEVSTQCAQQYGIIPNVSITQRTTGSSARARTRPASRPVRRAAEAP